MMISNWILDMPDNFNEIELLEPILSLRTILFQELLGLSTNVEMKHSLLQGLVKHCENVSRLARHAGRYQVRNIRFPLSINYFVWSSNEWSVLEPIVKQRFAVKTENVCTFCNNCKLTLNFFQISEKAITTIKELQKTGETALTTVYSWKIEEAKVFWFQKEEETAKRLLRQINQTVKVSLKVVKQHNIAS